MEKCKVVSGAPLALIDHKLHIKSLLDVVLGKKIIYHFSAVTG